MRDHNNLIHNNFLLTERFSVAADLYDRGKPMMRTILYVSALTLALSSPALAEMHGGGGHGGGGHGGGHGGGVHMARGGDRGGHARFNHGNSYGFGCAPWQIAEGLCGPGY
jgi:hypothetical protein